MTSPRVSVIVRTKDRADFLTRALASITAQTLDNWEAIIINDGGDPIRVAAVVSALRDSTDRARIRVIDHAESRGRWVAANAGVLAASGDYLVLHDDDDSWHPSFLSRAVEYLDRNPERQGVVSRIEIIWEQEKDGRFIEDGREEFQAQLTAPLLGDALLFNRFVPIGFLYRRDLHAELGLYDERLPVVGDWDFNLKVLSRGGLEYLGDEPLAYWHQRRLATGTSANSVSGARSDHARYDASIRDEALRRWVGDNGTGLVLYLTKFIDQRFVDVEDGLRAEIAASSLWRRLARRLRRTLKL
ncbi:glycosyltransferase family 2 protein [Microbacterium sp. YJN-G]|uniref:glycosyltransferase family 2 protein n=1 Tax=Microbacterium sp. YJN-G TaxID=2763257 RepID=UPI0018776029|nr:glycosyltransferase [Microbacterium sp. YJN-G]